MQQAKTSTTRSGTVTGKPCSIHVFCCERNFRFWPQMRSAGRGRKCLLLWVERT